MSRASHSIWGTQSAEGCWWGPGVGLLGRWKETYHPPGVLMGPWGAAWPPKGGVQSGLGARGLRARGVTLGTP